METVDLVYGGLLLTGALLVVAAAVSIRRERRAELALLDRILRDAALRERERQRDLWRGQKRR